MAARPGVVLVERFMRPYGLTANALALALRVPATRIADIVLENKPRRVTAETALRLARYFGNEPEYWRGLQAAYDLGIAREAYGAAIDREVEPRTDQIPDPG